MKKTLKILLLALAASLVLNGCNTSNEDIVAVVNGTKTTKSDFPKKTALKVGKEYEMIFGEEIWTSEVEGGKTFKEEFDNEILNVMISQR